MDIFIIGGLKIGLKISLESSLCENISRLQLLGYLVYLNLEVVKSGWFCWICKVRIHPLLDLVWALMSYLIYYILAVADEHQFLSAKLDAFVRGESEKLLFCILLSHLPALVVLSSASLTLGMQNEWGCFSVTSVFIVSWTLKLSPKSSLPIALTTPLLVVRDYSAVS